MHGYTKGMKAVTFRSYGPPEVLALEQVDTPSPGAHEVLVRVHAAAVTTADCAMRKGDPFVTRLVTGLLRPKTRVLGTEFAGRIEAVGAAVTRFRVGDEVFAASGTSFGAHAEYLCLPEDGALALKPNNLDHAEAAAACEGALTALPFLRDEAALQPGQSVLVNGASGSVGTAAVQLAKVLGAEVTGVCSTRNLGLVSSLGADAVIDYTREDFTEAVERYDVIFDTVGKSSFARSKRALKPGGIYLTTVLSPAILWTMAWTRLRGGKRAKLAFTGLRPPADKAADLVRLKALVEAGKLTPFVEARYPMEQAARAHHHVETGHKRGNVVMAV